MPNRIASAGPAATAAALAFAISTDAVLDYTCWMVVMGKVEKIEQQVQALSPEELAQFRAWFLEFDWAAWDRQIEQDVRAGRLDALAEQALRDHASGKTKPL